MKSNKTNSYFFYKYGMAFALFTMYHILCLLFFKPNIFFHSYFCSFWGITSNIIFCIIWGGIIFDLSNYLKKKKFHLNTNTTTLIYCSILIYVFSILCAICFNLGHEYPNELFFWKTLYARTISITLISVIYIIRNYGQIIEENTIQNQELKESLQKESEKATKAQMNMLKLQLDPHFMLNSLNTLMGLIEENPKKAEDFTLELSRIYKYIVANLDQDAISLKAGMAFINNYCQLIEIRYPQQFCVEIEQGIVQDAHEKILPLSLQLLVENAIKHNQHSAENPLRIQIKREDNYVCVTNTLNPYPDNEKAHILSMGIGMKNLNDRYKLISDRIPIALQSKDEYTVKIPII